MSLFGNIKVSINFTNDKEGVDLSTPSETISQNVTKSSNNGRLYHDQISLSASEVKVLDLGDSSLSDVYGDTIALTGLTSLYIKSSASNTNTFTISGTGDSFLNTLPEFEAGEGIGFAQNIDLSVNSKLYIVNNALSGSVVDIILTGNE